MLTAVTAKSILRHNVVLLTGSSGLVGHAMLAALRSVGAIPFTVGRSPECDLCVDLSTDNAYQALTTAPHINAVVHTAAAVPKDKTHDTLYLANATRSIDRCIARFIRERNVSVIYISGTSIYSYHGFDYITEDCTTYSNHSHYINAKRLGDNEFTQYQRSVVLRVSTPIGRYVHKNSMLGVFINSAINSGSIDVWGTGSREQNYVLVDDIARFMIVCLSQSNYGVFNVAHDSPSTSLEIAKIVASLTGADIFIGRKSDPNESTCARYSIARAKSAGFQSNLSLARIIKCVLNTLT